MGAPIAGGVSVLPKPNTATTGTTGASGGKGGSMPPSITPSVYANQAASNLPSGMTGSNFNVPGTPGGVAYTPVAPNTTQGLAPLGNFTTPLTRPANLSAATGGAVANPFQQASLAQQAALAGTAGAGTVAGANLGQYMNPYTKNVLGGLAAETGRAMNIGANQIGTQATQAGAFGGSRHGVAQGTMMGELGRGYQQQAANLLQSGYTNAQAMAQQDIQNRMNQAAQLANLGQQSFGYGRTLQQDLAQQGANQQAIQQALIDAAKAQYAGYQGAPAQGAGLMAQALGGTPTPQSQTSSSSPGLFDYLTTGATLYSAYAM